MTFIPKNEAKGGGMSALERFRMSPLYRSLLQKKGKTKDLLVQSMIQGRATLMERARSWIYIEGRSDISIFSNALIAKMVDVGLDRAIVDVVEQGPACVVYMSDRIGKYGKELSNLLSEIAEVEMTAKPSESGIGVFVFQMTPKDNVDFQAFTEKLLSKTAQSSDSKNESARDDVSGFCRHCDGGVDPSFLPIRRPSR